MLNPQQNNSKQLLSSTQKLGKSSEETTRTVQKIKAINESLVEITQQQYDVVNRVYADGEQIKTMLSKSVQQADNSLSILNETVTTIESGFNRIEDSIHLFDKIKESTQSLFKVARHQNAGIKYCGLRRISRWRWQWYQYCPKRNAGVG